MPRRLSFPSLSFSQQPLVFIAIAFIGGLLCAARYALAPRVWLLVLAVIWLLSVVLLWLKRGSLFSTALLLCGCFVAGGTLWALNEAGVASQRVKRLLERGELRVDEPCELWGTLEAMPEPAPERVYLNLAVEQVATLSKTQAASGAVRLVVPFSDAQDRLDYDALQLDYGSRLRVLGFLNNRGGYRNPGAPQFDELLEYQGYDARGSVKSPLLIEWLGEGRRNGWLWRLYRLRAQALAALLRNCKQPAAGILAAALLGNRYFLERETAQTFREGGTFHLLVISGLHVVLIAGALLWLSAWLKRERWLRYGIVTAFLWAYALMVGAQPSITRAVVMITIALVGQLIFRATLGANTLAAAALVLLSWQPRDLFNPGFQLSFLTVLAVVLLAVPVYTRLQQIGVWRPAAATPYPPRAPRVACWLAEALCWNEREFEREMARARLHYRLQKARAARWLSRSRLQWALAWVAATLFTTTCVQLALLPLMIAQFHRFSLVSPLTNVIEGALVFVLMIVGALHLVVYALSANLALWLALLANWLGKLIVITGQLPLALPLASLRVPDWGAGATWAYGAYFALICVVVLLINQWNPLRKGDEDGALRRQQLGRVASTAAVSAIACLSWLLIAHPFAPDLARGRLSVTFLDVGQGDAIFISFPAGKTMLLDSGGRLGFAVKEERMGEEQDGLELSEEVFIEDRIGIGEAAVMPYLWRLGLRRLDYIAATHGDSDHSEAFGEIVESFAIGQALTGSLPNAETDLFARGVRERGLPLRVVKRGEALELDGVRLEALSPFAASGEPADNNSSLVLRLSLGKRVFLLTGDIEREAEARLLAAGSELRADVLKVAHHGSRTSSTQEFLERVQPLHAVISVADPSPYGHPHPEVVERLQATGAKLWRTSRCGAITISTDGEDLRVETFVKCE
jgi:competence protein ComEC